MEYFFKNISGASLEVDELNFVTVPRFVLFKLQLRKRKNHGLTLDLGTNYINMTITLSFISKNMSIACEVASPIFITKELFFFIFVKTSTEHVRLHVRLVNE